MRERVRVVVAVARDPGLVRIELAYFGFNMTEYATWIAILVYGFALGGATTAGVVAMVQLIPAGVVAPFAAFAGDRVGRGRRPDRGLRHLRRAGRYRAVRAVRPGACLDPAPGPRP